MDLRSGPLGLDRLDHEAVLALYSISGAHHDHRGKGRFHSNSRRRAAQVARVRLRPTPSRFGAFCRRRPSSADSLAPYLNWDRQHYTRNLIDRTPLYELMAICWEVGQASSVHNHRDQNCWMAVPIGRLQVENFHLVHQDLQGGRCRLEPTQHGRDEYLAAVRGRSGRSGASRGESSRIQPARRQPACLFAAVRYLRGVLAGTGDVRGNSAPLQHRVRKDCGAADS